MLRDEEIMRGLQEALRGEIVSGSGCGPFCAAVFAADGKRISLAFNDVVNSGCSHGHAEMNALVAAERAVGSWNLAGRGFTLYTTAEPCMMCVGGILWSGVERVVYGVPTETVERVAGFDEGFKPGWKDEFARRGVEVVGPLLSGLGEEVMREYVNRGGVAYSPKRGR